MKSIIDFAAYAALRILLCIVQALRLETCRRAVPFFVWLVADVLRLRDKVIDENLRHAFPNKNAEWRQRILRENWAHLFLLVIEIAHAVRKIHQTNWRRYIQLRNKRKLVGTLLEDRPCVLVSGHFGNFEIAGMVVGMWGFKTFAVARPLDNPYLNRWLNQVRGTFGQRVLPKQGSSGAVEDSLARGETLAVLGDQAAGPKGCWVEFFGRPASTHKAIALFSMSYQAPLLVCYARRLGRPLDFEVAMEAWADPAEEASADFGLHDWTQWYTSRLEDAIRRSPEQYWWVHRRWKDYGRPRRLRQAA